jgi:hypothetical protein
MLGKRLTLLAAMSGLCLISGCMNTCDRPSLFQRLRGTRADCPCEACPCDGCSCGCPCNDGPVLEGEPAVTVPHGGNGVLPMPTPLAPAPPLNGPPTRLVPEPQAQPMPAAPSSHIR